MSKRKSSSELEIQQAIWYEKLKAEGFVDIEDRQQNLKQHNLRTNAYQNKDIVLEFYLRLDQYLNEQKDLKDLHRTILELYSEGKRIVNIAQIVERTPRRIGQIIAIYKRKIRNEHLI